MQNGRQRQRLEEFLHSAFCIHHAAFATAPARSRTWISSFARSRGLHSTTGTGRIQNDERRTQNAEERQRAAFHSAFIIRHSAFDLPSPGLEPGTRRSKRRMMSISPQGRSAGATHARGSCPLFSCQRNQRGRRTPLISSFCILHSSFCISPTARYWDRTSDSSLRGTRD